MKKPFFALLVLLTTAGLVYLAYILPSQMLREALVTPSVPVVTPTVTPIEVSPTAIADVTPTVTPLLVTGEVYVRDQPNGAAVGSLSRGDVVLAVCDGNWCKVEHGFIWRGCLSDNPDGLGCEAR